MRELESTRPVGAASAAVKAGMVALLLAGSLGIGGAASAEAQQASPPAAGTTSQIFPLSGEHAEATAAASGDRDPGALRAAPAAVSPGWSAALDVADGSQAVGVAWDGTGRAPCRSGDGVRPVGAVGRRCTVNRGRAPTRARGPAPR